MSYTAHRPRGHKGPADAHLTRIVRELKRTLGQTQRELAYDTLRLDTSSLGDLAGMLVDFAADLHCETGIWEAYERYNVEFFNTALPLTSVRDGDLANRFHADRFRHFLWVLYPVLLDGLVLSPDHQDLQRISQSVSAHLADSFVDVPKDSGTRSFLSTPNKYGWDVKRKLVWLGTHSFLFRGMFARYMDEKSRATSIIGRTDDFVCQECSAWSGLGVIDLLSGILDISNDDRRDLRSWYERHGAFYRIESAHGAIVDAVNVVNAQPYRIRVSMEGNPFERGQLVFGSTVPWRGEWYWSGEQQMLGDAADFDVAELVKTMQRQTPAVVCRYSKEYEQQVRERAAEIHHKTLAFHEGQDLIVYSDGLAMAADMQKELRRHWASVSSDQAQSVAKQHGLSKGQPEIKLPQQLIEQQDGLGVFLNPDEGKEIMTGFTHLIAGFKKKGEGLNDHEVEAIRGFMESDSISPRFIRRVLQDHSAESILTAYLLRDEPPSYWLDYLLRRFKGHFYRTRYPSLALV